MDSANKAKKEIVATKEIKPNHSPRLATLMSAVVPGTGQIYNEKYWKAPVIYAGFGVFGYFVHSNHQKYVFYRDIYNNYKAPYELENEPVPANGTTIVNGKNVHIGGVIEGRDYYHRWRDLNAIFFGVWYILNVVDANVDGHFYDFDVSDNLSFHWQPNIQPDMFGNTSLGANFKIQF